MFLSLFRKRVNLDRVDLQIFITEKQAAGLIMKGRWGEIKRSFLTRLIRGLLMPMQVNVSRHRGPIQTVSAIRDYSLLYPNLSLLRTLLI